MALHDQDVHLQVGDITTAIQQLETVFMKAECDMKYASRKLDTEFDAVFADYGQENVRTLLLIYVYF